MLHFGSKAKFLVDETDVLDIGDLDSSAYLSELDGPSERPVERSKLNSVIVKPVKSIARSNLAHRKRNHSSQRVNVANRIPSRIEDFNSEKRNRVADTKVCAWNNTTSQIAHAKQTETRGTQTERTGPCKCARTLQQRNQRKRSENKINKQIVDTLERVNVIKFSN